MVFQQVQTPHQHVPIIQTLQTGVQNTQEKVKQKKDSIAAVLLNLSNPWIGPILLHTVMGHQEVPEHK